MGFAYMPSASICTKKIVKTRRKMSPDVKARRDYIRSHNFSIKVDDSGRCEITITEKGIND